MYKYKKNTKYYISLLIMLIIICFFNAPLCHAASNKKIKVSLKSSTYTYTGKALKPKITVKYGNKKLTSKNYKTIYPKGRKNVGKYTVKVKLKGKYKGKTLKGTKKTAFTIIPPVPNYEISKYSGIIKVSFSKNKQITGYQICYKENTKDALDKNITSTSLNNNIKDLKDNIQYVFKVRAYKTVKGKKYWSNWSASKYVTVSDNNIDIKDTNDNSNNNQYDTDESNTDIDEADSNNKSNVSNVTNYSYEIVPIVDSLNNYFYIKTNNPDPNTFRFIDKSTKYASSGGLIVNDTTIYPDIVYENVETTRVNGGYIAMSGSVDGGTLILQERIKVVIKVNDDPHDPYSRIWKYDYKDTDVQIQLPVLYDDVDFLINKYGKKDTSLFDNLSEIQSGVYDWAYYSGHYVRGKIQKDEGTYYGLTGSLYKEQSLNIISPYYSTDNKNMFISRLYPFILDSIAFPSLMSEIANRLEPDVIISDVEGAHYMIQVTYDGQTHGYGGAGVIKGVGISENNIIHPFIFDNSDNDAFKLITDMTSLKNIFIDYFDYEEPSQITDTLTWKDICKTVGSKGGYVIINAGLEDGKQKDSFNYLYDTGIEYPYTNSAGLLSNAWFEGRYYNDYEYLDKGITFEDTITDNIPNLVFKDYYCPLPDDGHDYIARMKVPNEEQSYKFYQSSSLKDRCYDPETGEWKGILIFSFDATSQSWKPSQLYSYDYSEIDDFSTIRYIEFSDAKNNSIYINDVNFLDGMEITLDEARLMNLDSNTNTNPTEYYIYNMTDVPGTHITDK